MTLRHQVYTVYSVLADANCFDVWTTADPSIALMWLESQRIKYRNYGTHQAHGIRDPHDEERGDIEYLAQEEVFMMLMEKGEL